MNKAITFTAITALAIISAAGITNAEDTPECYTADYQGAPIDVCPEPVPDPTNCYTSWYQGATEEVCMPTGVTLPEGTTYHDGTPWAGQPILIHNAAGYVPPTEPVAAIPAAVPTTPTPTTPTRTALWPAWLDQLQAVLVANGGW